MEEQYKHSVVLLPQVNIFNLFLYYLILILKVANYERVSPDLG